MRGNSHHFHPTVTVKSKLISGGRPKRSWKVMEFYEVESTATEYVIIHCVE